MSLLQPFIFLVLWGGFGVVSASPEFPNPQKEWRMCGRAKPSFVCDPDFILGIADADQLDRLAQEFRRSTACLCPKCPDDTGVSIGIFLKYNVSKSSLSAYPNGKALSEMLRRRWGLSTCDGDIVVVLIPQLNISDFSLGSAVQTIFPPETGSQIMRQCQVHFDSEWYYQGLESVINSFNDVILKLQKKQDSKPVIKNMLLGIGLGFLVLVILAVTAIILIHRQQVKKRKDKCSDIYEAAQPHNRRKPSFSMDEHMDKLKRLNSDNDDEEEDEDEGMTYGQYTFRHLGDTLSSSVHFMRLHRQLSDVAEESTEDAEILRRNSELLSSSYHSSKPNVPVTEL